MSARTATTAKESDDGRDHAEEDAGTAETDDRDTEIADNEPAPGLLIGKHAPDHWQLVAGAALVAAGVGTILTQPALLLVTITCIGVLLLRQVSTPPRPSLAIDRSLSTDQPRPDENVEVETTLTNVGESTLADCRFVDLLPGELHVVDGSPRTATQLRPDESCTLQYEIEMSRGLHRFEGVHAVVSDRAGTTEHEYRFDSEQEITCRPEPEPLQVPVLGKLTTPYAGRLATETPGEGLEFYSVREYRTGDALKRIDWNKYASSRELTTLQFRTEQSAAVVLVADVRPDAYVRADDEDRHAADRCVDAVGRLLVTLLDDDHRVGIATFGPDFWLAPAGGTAHRNRALDALASEPALSPAPPDEEFPIRLRALQLLQRMTGKTQVIVCSPLVDDFVEIPIQMLESAGHEVAVVSPDPTREKTPGDVVTALERKRRISRIHSYGVPVVDWPLGESLDVVVARTMQGWSR